MTDAPGRQEIKERLQPQLINQETNEWCLHLLPEPGQLELKIYVAPGQAYSNVNYRLLGDQMVMSNGSKLSLHHQSCCKGRSETETEATHHVEAFRQYILPALLASFSRLVSAEEETATGTGDGQATDNPSSPGLSSRIAELEGFDPRTLIENALAQRTTTTPCKDRSELVQIIYGETTEYPIGSRYFRTSVQRPTDPKALPTSLIIKFIPQMKSYPSLLQDAVDHSTVNHTATIFIHANVPDSIRVDLDGKTLRIEGKSQSDWSPLWDAPEQSHVWSMTADPPLDDTKREQQERDLEDMRRLPWLECSGEGSEACVTLTIPGDP